MKCKNRRKRDEMIDNALKFSLQDELTALVESLIKKENRPSVTGTGFKPSEVTQCHRRLIYRILGEKPYKDQISRVSYLEEVNNKFLRKKWREILDSCKRIKILEVEPTVADCNYNITDIVDIVANIDGIISAVKIHGVENSYFSKIQKNGALRKHVIEVMIQMWLLEINDGLLIYENKNNQSYVIFHVKPYEPIISSVRKKCLGLRKYKITGGLPERSYSVKTSKECEQCEFKQPCWSK